MIFAILGAIFWVLAGYYVIRAPQFFFQKYRTNKTETSKRSIMLIFGSGGHTTELLMTFKNFDFQAWKNVYFVKAESDITSQNKVVDYIKTNKV